MSSRQSLNIPEKAWHVEAENILKALESEQEGGLTRAEVQKRLEQFGQNQLREHQTKSLWQILVEQVKSLIILLLAVAALVSFLYNEILEGWAIAIVIVINTAIGFFTELRAVRSMEAKVQDIMDKEFYLVQIDDNLTDIYRKVRSNNKTFFPVMKGGRLAGAIDMNNINEFMTFRAPLDY